MRKESFQIEKGKVALISGGGSGHEPFCAGYIGETSIYDDGYMYLMYDLLAGEVDMKTETKRFLNGLLNNL